MAKDPTFALSFRQTWSQLVELFLAHHLKWACLVF